MIIVKLIGGLGNQMFQYAVGCSLAEKRNTILKLDIRGFDTYKLHKYSLSHFEGIQNFATQEEVEILLEENENHLRTKILRKIFYKQSSPVIERCFSYDSKILKLPDNIYLDGYWQSEMYFKDIQTFLRKSFTVKNQQFNKNKVIAELIQGSNSVSLHIRRGDYVAHSKTNEIYGVCDLNYYYNAIQIISQKVTNPQLFIFSDDPQWAKDNLKTDLKMIFVDHNNADSNFEDLRLMSQCKHNIIANSSFSWWGAWLNENPVKLIFAPKRWFSDDSINTKDLIPKSWIRI